MTDSKKAEKTYDIKWLGFNEQPNHDRIWGHIKMKDGRDYVFWGPRSGRLDFKRHSYGDNIRLISNEKQRKGYKKIHIDHYELICPGFKEKLEDCFMVFILMDETR